MRPFFRSALTFTLVTSMGTLPAIAGGERPLGMVVATQLGHLDRTQAATGANLYSGDAISTDPGGTLRLKVGSSQMYLLSSSAATLAGNEAKVHATLVSGTIGFSAVRGDQLEVETPIGIVRPANDQRAFGEVTITAPGKILIAAYRGSLVISGPGEERTIKEGTAYNVSSASDKESSSEGVASSRPQHTRNNGSGRLIFTLAFAGAAGAAGAAGYAIYRSVNEAESGSSPQ